MKPRHVFALLISFVFPSLGVTAATLEEIIATPERWPAEVTVVSATRATELRNGQPAGAILLGAGRTITISGIAADGVTGKVGGTTVRVPVEKTDLLQRLGGQSAPAAPPPAAVAESAPAAAPERAATTPSGRVIPPAMQRLLGGKLVRAAGGRMQPHGEEDFAGVKYIALYYSASWCGPCRAFTPRLVRAYQELKAAHPEFEVVFVSADRSAGAMAEYMRDDGMPWPAVKYDLRDHKIMSYSGPGIPCLVLVDAQGQVLADSYENEQYIGPQSVLEKTRRLLKNGRL